VSNVVAIAGLSLFAVTTQAPQSADMWRVAVTTLATPPALVTGPTAQFWNPAVGTNLGPHSVDFSGGVHIVETSNVVGLSGTLVGAHKALGANTHIGLVLGHIKIGDLVRTTTSPLQEVGEIPVFEQVAGASAGLTTGPVQIGAIVRGHHSRFDAERSNGVTIDAGIRFRPADRLLFAAATHFFPISFTTEATTDYYGGIEFLAVQTELWSMAAVIIGRYGTSYHRPGGVDHTFGAGLSLDRLLHFNGALINERAYGTGSWRSVLDLELAVGRYSIAFARASGLNDLGANYRVGLDVVFAR
jgi:hypothetical protein